MTPERRLAHAVLLLAAHDATHAVVPQRRESARSFLAGGPMLAFWCAVAGIHPDLRPAATRPDFPPDLPLTPVENVVPGSTVRLASSVKGLDTSVTRAFEPFSSASPFAGQPDDDAATIGDERRVSPTFVVRRRGDFEGERLDF